jgi:hypothetical protein
MNFTVTWLASAEDELATIWLEAPNRDAITQAAAKIDHRLKKRPLDEGESRENGRRILIETPLAVVYRVDVDDRLVRVLQIWRIDRHDGA